MQLQDFAGLLADIEVFRGLRPDQLEAVAACMDRIVFRAGQRIITAGEVGDGAFLLVGGEAEAVVDAPTGTDAEPVIPGSLIGEMAMLIEHQHRLTVVARSSVRGCKITRAALHRAMLEDASLADHFVHKIASRLTRVAVELRRIDAMLALAAEPQPMPVAGPAAPVHLSASQILHGLPRD